MTTPLEAAVAKAVSSRAAIARLDAKDCSADQFVERFLYTNTPCMIGGLTAAWRAQEWCVRSEAPGDAKGAATSHSSIAFDFLSKRFGDSSVCIAECGTQQYTDQRRYESTLRDYLAKWQRGEVSKAGSALYLKDWHFSREFPEYQLYVTPDHFADDWMNAYWDHLQHDDYRCARWSLVLRIADRLSLIMAAMGAVLCTWVRAAVGRRCIATCSSPTAGAATSAAASCGSCSRQRTPNGSSTRASLSVSAFPRVPV